MLFKAVEFCVFREEESLGGMIPHAPSCSGEHIIWVGLKLILVWGGGFT